MHIRLRFEPQHMQLRLLRHIVLPLPAAVGNPAIGFVRVQTGEEHGCCACLRLFSGMCDAGDPASLAACCD